jgi:hypothetical protein
MTHNQYSKFINSVDATIKFDIVNNCGNDACSHWIDRALCLKCMESGRCIEVNSNLDQLCKIYHLSKPK